MTIIDDIREAAGVAGERRRKVRAAAEDKQNQIKIQILVAGAHEELVDGAVNNICDIFTGKFNQLPIH